MMENNVQSQRAGEHSQQIQMLNPTFVCGIDEKRVREVCSEIAVETLKQCTAEATATAEARIEAFTTTLVPRIERIEEDFHSFAEPDFQFSLRSAQKTAAASDREADYEMLSELLVHRVEKKEDRKTRASISKAIEIVNEVDDDALCALTVAYAMESWGPMDGIISEGCKTLNSLLQSLLYLPLPQSFDWAYHLDVLNALRVSSLKLKKLADFYPAFLTGYVCAGIQKSSESYQQALDILDNAKLPHILLTDHELLDGYVRLPIRDQNLISKTIIPCITGSPPVVSARKVNDSEIVALNKIWALYSDDSNLKTQVRNEFMQKWDTYKALQTVHAWWDNIPHSFTITPIGKVLAHANAQRYNKSVPDF